MHKADWCRYRRTPRPMRPAPASALPGRRNWRASPDNARAARMVPRRAAMKKARRVEPPGEFLLKEDNLPQKGEAGERPHGGNLLCVTCQRQDSGHRQIISVNLPLSRVSIRDYPACMNAALYRRHRKLLFSGRRWRMRLVFWGGALAVGVVSVAFAALATQATHFCHQILARPWAALSL